MRPLEVGTGRPMQSSTFWISYAPSCTAGCSAGSRVPAGAALPALRAANAPSSTVCVPSKLPSKSASPPPSCKPILASLSAAISCVAVAHVAAAGRAPTQVPGAAGPALAEAWDSTRGAVGSQRSAKQNRRSSTAVSGERVAAVRVGARLFSRGLGCDNSGKSQRLWTRKTTVMIGLLQGSPFIGNGEEVAALPGLRR